MVKFPTDTRMTRIDTHYLAIKIEKNKTIWTSQFAEALANGPPDLSWVGAAGKMLCFFYPKACHVDLCQQHRPYRIELRMELNI